MKGTEKDFLMLLSLPNVLTFLRIGLIPLVSITFFKQPWLAPVIFLAACLTDFLDGFLARLLNQTSLFGQFLDPIADKLLIISTLFLLAGFGHLNHDLLIPATLIIWREILISGLRGFISQHYRTSLKVMKISRWKTLLQMIAVGLLLLATLPTSMALIIKIFGLIFLWAAALLTVFTGLDYCRQAWILIQSSRER